MCVDLANCGGDCPECRAQYRLDTADRIPIDSGEIRYQFIGKRDGQLEATFSGPHVGTVFTMTLDDARQMRDDLCKAILLLESK